MPEPAKRCIVDGVDLHRLFAFPRILLAAAGALQPARLAIALLMVTALIAGGRLWDALTPHRVHPQGLASGAWAADSQGGMLQMQLHRALNIFAETKPSLSGSDAEKDLEPHAVLKQITAGYRALRAKTETAKERDRLDRDFAEEVRTINMMRPRGDFEATVDAVSEGVQRLIASTLLLSPALAVGSAKSLFIDTPRLLWLLSPWFVIVYGLFAVAILSTGGGAISRMTACQTADGQRLSAREAVDFAFRHWVRLIAAQLLPLLIAAVVVGAIVLAGVLMAAPILDIIGGVLYGLVLLGGLLAAFLLVGYALGFPMLVPAVACENCDSADAMQRSYAYVLTRPLHLLFYGAVALIGLSLGFLLVALLARLTLNVAGAAFGVISDNPALLIAGRFEGDMSHDAPAAVPGAWHSQWAATAIAFWQALVLCLVSAYVVSCHFSVSTMVYLLMRKASDGQDVEDIWRPGLLPGTMAVAAQERAPASAAAAKAE